MNVSFRHTRTGLLALAAAGIFAAGTVADRANRVHDTDADRPEPTAEQTRLTALGKRSRETATQQDVSVDQGLDATAPGAGKPYQ